MSKKTKSAATLADKKKNNKTVKETTATTVENPTPAPAQAPEPKPEEKPEPTPTPAPEPAPASENKKSDPKPAEKPANKPAEKQTKKKPEKESEKEVETIIPEVIAPKPSEKKNSATQLAKAFNVAAMNALANGDRISADQGITLMNLIHQRYLNNPDTPADAKEFMSKQFDAMALRNIILWNAQTKEELGNAGLKVNEEMFNAINEGLALYYGIEAKALPSPDGDGQLQLQFEAPQEVEKQAKESKEAEKQEISIEYKEGMSEEEIQNALAKILNQSGAGMDNNLKNAIAFAKKAYSLTTGDPSEVVAAIIQKLPKGQLLLEGFGRMIYGSYTTNDGPFTAHAILKSRLKSLNYSDNQLAKLVQLFFVLGARVNYEKVKSETASFADYVEPWNMLTKALNDQIIIDIIGTQKNPTSFVEVPKITGLSTGKFNCPKILHQLKDAYGTNLNDSQLKKQMQIILSLYQKEEMDPMADYIEKSIYATSK